MAAAGCSLLVALLLAELVARARWGVPLEERLPILEVRANPRRGFEMVPGEHYTYLNRVRVNRLGLRGPEVADKAPGEARVLLLGDSLVYGQGLAEEDTLPARLERELGPAARVVNGGLRAYTTRHELALLEELAPAIRPDAVVLCWYENDLEWPDVEGAFEALSRTGPVAFDTGSRMEGAARILWRGKQLLRRSALLMKLHDAWSARTVEHLTPQEVEEGFARLDQDLEAFARLAREQGFDFALAVVPPAPDGYAERVGALAARRGFPFLDLTPAVREVEEREGARPVLPYDGHYTGAANAAMARATARMLRDSFPGRFAR